MFNYCNYLFTIVDIIITLSVFCGLLTAALALVSARLHFITKKTNNYEFECKSCNQKDNFQRIPSIQAPTPTRTVVAPLGSPAGIIKDDRDSQNTDDCGYELPRTSYLRMDMRLSAVQQL